MIDLNKHKLSINVKHISKDVFGDREHKVNESNVSKKGKFKSYNIELIVHSDDDRTELHKVLGDHKDIKMVL
jgi:putative lipoic acid-binding regulatory protein